MASPSLGNVSFPAFRSALNGIIQDLDTLNAGATAPTNFEAYTLWLDTSTTPPVLKMRNAANNAWVDLFSVISPEGIQDIAAAMLVDGTHDGISFSYDDTNGEIDATVDGGGFTAGTPTTLSGAAVTLTGIPSGANLIKIVVYNATAVSSAFLNGFALRIGGSGGIETTGYRYGGSYAGVTLSGAESGTFFPFVRFPSRSGDFADATITLCKVVDNTWVFSSRGFAWDDSDGESDFAAASGSKALSTELTQIQLFGSTDFTGGTVQLFYQ